MSLSAATPLSSSLLPFFFVIVAGLRLLPINESQAIINEVQTQLQASPFLVTSPDSVSVISGQDEGIYAWVSINFLLGRFQSKFHDKTIPIMEMGGASLQVSKVTIRLLQIEF